MDGLFVPNISFGIPVIDKIKQSVGDSFILDTHLMITKPERYIEKFYKVGADILTIHIEASDNYVETLKNIKKTGMKAGISINPETKVECLDEVLCLVDLILIMSVHPGFGGQKFIDSSYEKINYINQKRKQNSYKYLIEVDGGIGENNLKSVLDSGVDIAVAGSAIFSNNVDLNLKKMNSIIGDYDE